MGKPERKRPLGRSRLRWKDNIKIGVTVIVLVGMNRISLAEDT
jgi:hypothetical protein